MPEAELPTGPYRPDGSKDALEREGPGRARGLAVALLCCDDPQHLFLADQLERRLDLVGVVLERNRAQKARLWRRRRWRDWLYRRYHSARRRLTGRSRYRRDFFLSQIPGEPAWPPTTLEVDWINDPAASEALLRWQPDVTIVCGTTIIGESLLALAGTAINVHGGCLPEYKGNHCVFFAFREGRFSEIGATLHRVTGHLDGGPILEVVRPSIYPRDDDESLYCRSVHLAMLRLFELIEDMAEGRQPSGEPQAAKGRVFRHRDRKPHLDLLLWLRRRLGFHRPPCIPNRHSARGRRRPG